MACRVDRFYLIDPLSGIIEDQILVHKIKNVLRKKIGDRIVLFDGQGREFSAVITDVAKRSVCIADVQLLCFCERPALELSLAFGMLKADHVDLILQRCTELGVDVFLPFVSAHTTSGVPGKAKAEHWRKVVAEAVGQSRRLWLPVVGAVNRYEQVCEKLNNYDTVLLADPYAVDSMSSIQELASKQSELATHRVLMVVGPEGGLSEAELEFAAKAGGKRIKISSFMLRAETAAISLSGLVAHYFDKHEIV